MLVVVEFLSMMMIGSRAFSRRLMTLAGRLPTTRWSLVIRSGEQTPDDPVARQSLEELCQMYWPALYGYLRHRGYSICSYQDLALPEY